MMSVEKQQADRNSLNIENENLSVCDITEQIVLQSKEPPFTTEEDLLLITEACHFESSVKNREKAEKLRFWQTVRVVFEQHSFKPRGAEQLKRQDQSPYYKRWLHIYSSYKQVRTHVIRSGTPMPQNQAELDLLVAKALSYCQNRKIMAKLSIGFAHFKYIFLQLDGLTDCNGIDGGVGASSGESSDEDDSISPTILPQAGSKVKPANKRAPVAHTPSPRSASDDVDDNCTDYVSDPEESPSTELSTNERDAKKRKAGKALPHSAKKSTRQQEYWERLARRTKQIQDDSLRNDAIMNRLADTSEQMAAALTQLAKPADPIDNVSQLTDQYIRLVQLLEQTTDPNIRRNLMFMQDMVFGYVTESASKRKKTQLQPELSGSSSIPFAPV